MIGVNSPREIAFFYDAARRGINDEAAPFEGAGVQIQHRVFPRLGEGEKDAFEEAIAAGLDGLIVVPGDLPSLKSSFRKAAKLGLPVLCLVTDAPNSQKLCSVSINTHSMGAISASLMGRFLGGSGKIMVTTGNLKVADHEQKFAAFEQTIKAEFPKMQVFPAIENHEIAEEAYRTSRAFVAKHRDTSGVYISTGNGAPVLEALDEIKLLGKLTVISTDVYASAVPHIRSGAVAAVLYERPYSQGRTAFRLMYEYLVEGRLPVPEIRLEPLLIMNSNLGAFISRPGSENQNKGNRAPLTLTDELVLFDQRQS
ncbi:substrate-binding domain-containing protein [Tunturiibacter empetritectus]|uniref:LacI family transcriptional regulator n=1 Tax=Tunturiibacter lichenicola TaxID=2051959 RepID=A0A852VK56_9BACT|nr:substrate-binding domain-containing protein [Edaphobacter lichenicola]NYF91541.1 LacI family transcriptional regulator [Edaphobacter lichenicola]